MRMMRPGIQNIIKIAILGFVLALSWWTVVVRAGEIPGKKINICVRETASVKGPLILLGEIAQISSPAFFAQGLADIELGRSPKPGRMKQLSREKIYSLVRTRGLEDSDMVLEIPKRVFIKRKSQVLNETRIKKEFSDFLTGFFSEQDFKIKAFRVRGLDPYPEGEMTLVFDQRYIPGNKGRLSVHADVIVDGVKEDRITVNSRVALYKLVVCAARPLAKGVKISRADIRLKTQNTFELKPGFLENMEDALHMVLTSRLETDACVTRKNFKEAPVIQKGDIVKLVARKTMLSIATLGITREDGYLNRPVMVENLRSGKLVRGVVKDDGSVEVMF